MAVNKYAAPCDVCGSEVPANGGVCESRGRRRGYRIRHLACEAGPAVTTYRFASGHTETRNSRGRCEDAPCCGCCTF